jgi:hypothetical protein
MARVIPIKAMNTQRRRMTVAMMASIRTPNGGPPSQDPNGFIEVPLTAIPRNMSGGGHIVPLIRYRRGGCRRCVLRNNVSTSGHISRDSSKRNFPRNMSGGGHIVPQYTAATTSAPVPNEPSSYVDEKVGSDERWRKTGLYFPSSLHIIHNVATSP